MNTTTKRNQRMDAFRKRHTSEMDPQANTARAQMIDLAIKRHKTMKPASYHTTNSFSIREDEEASISLSASEAREFYLAHIRGNPKPKSAFFTAKDKKFFRQDHDDNANQPDPIAWYRQLLNEQGFKPHIIQKMLAT